MADEQIIYLSPEEELTNVRERLEKTQARHIILVIPPQTQLRSHVGWRLLRSRTRELNKDVLVISSDRQIRAVVKAAGFRVADSQESPASGGMRPGSRPSRSGSGGRTPARVRNVPGTGTGRGTPDRGSSTDIRRREQPARITPDKQSSTPQEPVSRVDDPSKSGTTNPISSTFGPGYDYRIETSPSRFTAKPEQEDDEPDQLVEDYNVAQSILRAAEQGKIGAATNPTGGQLPPPQSPGAPHAFNEIAQDPFAFMEDKYPSPLPEQRGRSSLEELDEEIPDISNYPTSVLSSGDIEDLGDEGDIVKPGRSSPRSWSKPVLEEPETAESSRIYGVRPRNNRQGNIPQDDEVEDELPPIANQSTRAVPPPRRVTTPLPYARTRTPTPQPLAQPPAPGRPRMPTRGTPAAPQRGTGRPASTASDRQAAARMPTGTAPARRARTSGMHIGLIASLTIILFLVVTSVLIYFVPSADVTVTIPSQTFSTPLALTATAASQQDVLHHTLPATTLVFDTSVTGTGPASGSKKVGTTPATGTVIFTNNGNTPVDIPTGTIVSTTNGKKFATTVDALVLKKGSEVGNTVPVQVQAQVQGTDGNVPINSITVIPRDSLASIRQANNNAQVNLTVTNPEPITNGGVGNATTVTPSDIAQLKATLEPQVQQRANAWLAQRAHAGDVQGKPVQKEKVAATPDLGQITPSGTFMERLSLHMTVLVVRAADLQAAAQAEFNAAAMKAKAHYALVPQQKVNLKKTSSKTCTPVSSETSIILCYTATGQIAPQVSEQKIRDLMVRKPVQEAESELTSSVPGISSVGITINPGFFPWMPLQSQRISVHFKVVPASTTPNK
jgi:Baseplate J-like protein